MDVIEQPTFNDVWHDPGPAVAHGLRTRHRARLAPAGESD